MKSLLRNFLIHIVALGVTSNFLQGFTITGGARTLILGGLGLMFINIMIVPLLKIMFLPLNILTLGLFTWVINVVGLYILILFIPQIKILPFHFSGLDLGGINIPEADLNVLMVAVVASFIIGFISHFLQWLTHK